MNTVYKPQDRRIAKAAALRMIRRLRNMPTYPHAVADYHEDLRKIKGKLQCTYQVYFAIFPSQHSYKLAEFPVKS